MRLTRLCLAASAAALIATSASAQTPPPPAAAPAPAATQVTPAGDIIATLTASGQFTRLLAGLQAANLTQLLRTQPNITLFAPTDAAFNALPVGAVEQMISSQQIQGRLTYHLVNTRVPASAINGKAGPVPAVSGGNLHLDGTKSPPQVNDARILQADVNASNGIIHVIDKVLTPGFTPPAAAPAAETPAAQ